jgi:hypothetical protein
MGPPHVGRSAITKKTLIEARAGAFLGFNELRLREGDNDHTRPGRRNVDWTSWIFSAHGERFVTDNLAVRVQGWGNIPSTSGSDFFLDGAVQWSNELRYLSGDLAAVMHFGRGMTPYSAGLIAGYRGKFLDIDSQRPVAPLDHYTESGRIHIPYMGVYYAHSNFLGTVARFDIHASPIVLSTVKGAGEVSLSERMLRNLDGHSLTGIWFESFLQISLPISESFLAGAHARYDFLELHGGATVDSLVQGRATETRFSMDYRCHGLILGLSATFTF